MTDNREETTVAEEKAEAVVTETEEQPKKRGRGRPPKQKQKRRLKPEALEGDFRPEGTYKRFHYGVHPDSPLQFATVGAVSFCKTTYIPQERSGRIARASDGIVSGLSEENVERILNTIQHYVLRKIPVGDGGAVTVTDSDYEGERVRTEIHKANAGHYRRTEWDEPLCDHLYMIPEDSPAFNARDGKLPTIGEMYAD